MVGDGMDRGYGRRKGVWDGVDSDRGVKQVCEREEMDGMGL